MFAIESLRTKLPPVRCVCVWGGVAIDIRRNTGSMDIKLGLRTEAESRNIDSVKNLERREINDV